MTMRQDFKLVILMGAGVVCSFVGVWLLMDGLRKLDPTRYELHAVEAPPAPRFSVTTHKVGWDRWQIVIVHDAADGRCHAVAAQAAGPGYAGAGLGVVPCSVPLDAP